MPERPMVIPRGTTETVTDMSGFEKSFGEPDDIIHTYPRDPRYRVSGQIPIPQVGDIAWCGHVKVKPPHYGIPDGARRCESCERINQIQGKQ